ncbi:MAG: FAD-dependent oxidoreductase [Spirochaetales bacterium]|nr:FAD-dependent oxidoreductase [Spirochaetales bacterium]
MKNHYHYLIIGGGLAADAAVRGIRELDSSHTVGIISSEGDPPYSRPNLSKGLWGGKPLEKIWCNTQLLDVDLLLNRTIVTLNRESKTVVDEQGELYSYDKLLLATGGVARHLPFSGDRVIYYRTLQDYRKLKELSEIGENFLVIGGGFICSEIAAALASNGKSVVMVFPEGGIGEHVYPKELSQFITDYYRERGVEIVPNESVVTMEEVSEGLRATTNKGKPYIVDGVVAGVGLIPNTILAEKASLNVDNGIVVNQYLATADPSIYAAGDVANYPSKVFGKSRRVEHEDNALSMGKLAGRNMAGAKEPYNHTPYFYSDLFDLGYEAVGELNSSYETEAHWEEPYKKGVIYYLRDKLVKGVLLWNVWDTLDRATALLNTEGRL